MAGENTKVYFDQNGDRMVVGQGGKIKLVGTGTIESPGGTDLALAKRYQSMDIADGSAEATYYFTAKYAGLLSLIDGIVDTAVQTADITMTYSINGVAVTGGVVTFPVSGAAAGAQASASPSAANTVAVGDKISCVVTGGGSGGTPRIHMNHEITAQ